jgi:hypothetical protein
MSRKSSKTSWKRAGSSDQDKEDRGFALSGWWETRGTAAAKHGAICNDEASEPSFRDARTSGEALWTRSGIGSAIGWSVSLIASNSFGA